MTVIENYKNENKIIGTRNVLVGVKIDGRSREVLSWALVKVAEPGDSVVAIHVSRNPDHVRKGKPLLDEYLDVYEGLCSVKKVGLSGQIVTGCSVRKALVREAQNYTDVTLVLGISKKTTLGSTRGSTSVAKYCAKKLCSTTDVLAVYNGKIIYTSCTRNQPPGSYGDPKPCLGSSLREAYQSEFGESECDTETVFSFATGVSRSPSSMDPVVAVPGWPLLRRPSLNPVLRAPRTRNLSVVQWVMSLPDRSPASPIRCPTITEDEAGDTLLRLSSFIEAPREGLQSLVREHSFGCKWYPLDHLKASTCGFSSERLVGEGGCNRVYKGVFPGGKSVAVKILESSRQGWRDFALEFDIMSCLSHRHIAPLLGVCVEDDTLISVYDFLPNGNLEENLHGKNKNKLTLSWEVRYGIALGIAEALHYLHKECPQTVIHRDIKSSNILLSDELEPKLSDFGLAIWGPKGSNFITEEDVVGTFGYLAPEYFMYGKVSDKIDVYAFGVVLLELLSGRRPIGTDPEAAKGQDSLVMWAKPRIEKGDVKGLLDPDLDGKVDEAQIHRMALAAALCITRSARLRPNIAQVLKILKGEKEAENLCSLKNNFHHELENRDDDNNNDDEVYPDSSAELHLGVALLNIDDDSTSFNSSSNNLTLDDYFNGRWSRSSSFD